MTLCRRRRSRNSYVFRWQLQSPIITLTSFARSMLESQSLPNSAPHSRSKLVNGPLSFKLEMLVPNKLNQLGNYSPSGDNITVLHEGATMADASLYMTGPSRTIVSTQ